MERMMLLLKRVKDLAPYLRGETISVRLSGNEVQIDAGVNSTSTLQKAATDFFHQSYTNFKKS